MEISSADVTKWRFWTLSEISKTVCVLNEASDRVRNGVLPKARLEELEMSFGWNANAHAIWCDRDLSTFCEGDLVATISYDWVHAFLQDGVFSLECWLYMCSAELDVADLHRFLKADAWRWPASTHHKSSALHKMFDVHRTTSNEKADRLKASSSEILGLYGMLRHYVETRVPQRPSLSKQRASFEACCDVLDVVLMCKRGLVDIEDGARALDVAFRRHFELHLAAYSDENVRPKNHWMGHIAGQIRRHRCVVDAFVIERGHLAVKRIAEHVKNTSRFEASVLSGIINKQFSHVKEARIGSCLQGAVTVVQGISIASQMNVCGLQVLGDLSLRRLLFGMRIPYWWLEVRISRAPTKLKRLVDRL